MLLMLLPEQLDKFWPYIKYAVEDTFPAHIIKEKAVLNNILQAMLTSRMQTWIAVRGEDEIVAMIITSSYEDLALGVKILRVYAIYAFTVATPSIWEDGFNTISKYAKSIGCVEIEGYTTNSVTLKAVEKFGFKSDYRVYKEI